MFKGPEKIVWDNESLSYRELTVFVYFYKGDVGNKKNWNGDEIKHCRTFETSVDYMSCTHYDSYYIKSQEN